jgi:hypothetical protein
MATFTETPRAGVVTLSGSGSAVDPSIETPSPATLTLVAPSPQELVPVFERPTPGWIQLFGTANEYIPYYGTIEADLPVITALLVSASGMRSELPKITGEITGGIDLLLTIVSSLPVISGTISGGIEKFATITVRLPKTKGTLAGSADNTGTISKTLPRITGTLTGKPGQTGSISSTLPLIDGEITGVLSTTGTIVTTLPMIEAVLEGVSSVYEILSMNCENKALTTYTNWAFNSFCTYKGRRFACGDGGIYEIKGTTDEIGDGQIDITIKTGLLDFETQQVMMRLRHAFIGYSSSGALVLSVITDDAVQYDYPITSYTVNDGGQKVKLGKGFKDRYLAFQLANTAGATLNLDKLHIFGEPVTHRKR